MLDLETIKKLYLQCELDPENLKKYPEVRFNDDSEDEEVNKNIGKENKKSP